MDSFRSVLKNAQAGSQEDCQKIWVIYKGIVHRYAHSSDETEHNDMLDYLKKHYKKYISGFVIRRYHK